MSREPSRDSPHDDPDVPLVRNQDGVEVRFPPALVTLRGLLPPGFEGPVGALVLGLFRPCAVELGPGNYELGAYGRWWAAGGQVRRCPLVGSYALSVGNHLTVWLRNPTDRPQLFGVEVQGHQGDPSSPLYQELGCKVSVGIGLPELDLTLAAPAALPEQTEQQDSSEPHSPNLGPHS